MEVLKKFLKILILIVLLLFSVIGYIITFLYDITFKKNNSSIYKNEIKRIKKEYEKTTRKETVEFTTPEDNQEKKEVKVKTESLTVSNVKTISEKEVLKALERVYEEKTELKVEKFNEKEKEEFKELTIIITPIVQELYVSQKITKEYELDILIEYILEKEFKKEKSIIGESFLNAEKNIKLKKEEKQKEEKEKNQVHAESIIEDLSIEDKIEIITEYQETRIKTNDDFNFEPSKVNIEETIKEIEKLENNISTEEVIITGAVVLASENLKKEETKKETDLEKIEAEIKPEEKKENKTNTEEKFEEEVSKEKFEEEVSKENKSEEVSKENKSEEEKEEEKPNTYSNAKKEIDLASKELEVITNIYFLETTKEVIEDRNYSKVEEEFTKLESKLEKILYKNDKVITDKERKEIDDLNQKLGYLKETIKTTQKEDYKSYNKFLETIISYEDKLKLLGEINKEDNDNFHMLNNYHLNKLSDLNSIDNENAKKIEKKLIKNSLKNIMSINGGFLSFIPFIRNRYYSSFSKTILVNRNLKYMKSVMHRNDYVDDYDYGKVEYTVDALEENMNINKQNYEYINAIDRLVMNNYPEMALDLEYNIYKSMIEANINKKNEKLNKKYKYYEKTRKKGRVRVRK